ncbi:hypothetical protein DITRI_Ditri09bG0017900 [Diplodiscus trichospermus]
MDQQKTTPVSLGQKLFSSLGVGQQHISSPGANQPFISKSNIARVPRKNPSASHDRGDTRAQTETEEKAQDANFEAMLENHTHTIDRIACELSCKAFGDAHATTTAIFNRLSTYTWEDKLVVSLSAFALNYGEFWLLAQIHSTNQLAKPMAILRQLPSIIKHTAVLKPRFDALNNLIQTMMDVARCVVEFKELPPNAAHSPVWATAMTHIQTSVY